MRDVTPWRRFAVLAVVAGLAAGSVTGCAGAPGPGSVPKHVGSAPGGHRAEATVMLDVAYLPQFRAKVLVDSQGFSLYVFGPDHGRTVTCTGACALTWPPLTVGEGATLRAGPGVDQGLAGLTTSQDGREVATYNGWPLYTYVPDVGPGMASGEGINLNGGPWDLMRPDGSPLVPAGQPLLDGPGGAKWPQS